MKHTSKKSRVTCLATCLASTSDALRVCTSTTCRKADSKSTLEMLTTLAAASAPDAPPSTTAHAWQAEFGRSSVQACGCLGGCGRGPNCVGGTDEDPVTYYDVYKPKSGSAILLAELGLAVPEAATRAWLHRMYAIRALRKNQPAEALSLLTTALNSAGTLGMSGAHLIDGLLELRADCSDQLRDAEAAAADRGRAAQMRKLAPSGANG